MRASIAILACSTFPFLADSLAAFTKATGIGTLSVAQHSGYTEPTRCQCGTTKCHGERSCQATCYHESNEQINGSLEFISMASYNVYADVGSWHAPPPSRPPATPDMKDAVATCLVKSVLQATKPLIVLVEKTFLDTFIQKIGRRKSAPFVMLAVNSDTPLDSKRQHQLLQIPGLRAVYATDMHNAIRKDFFFPMPMGITGERDVLKLLQEQATSLTIKSTGNLLLKDEDLKENSSDSTQHMNHRNHRAAHEQFLKQTLADALAWPQKMKKLYVPPLGGDNRQREEYVRILKGAEYADLVHISEKGLVNATRSAAGRMPHAEYVREVAHYQAVLSPPGRGYDCYRTWEALAIGSVPLVMVDPSFDQRLFKDSGVVILPAPHDLTPVKLKKILDKLPDPKPFREKISTKWWREQWLKHLA